MELLRLRLCVMSQGQEQAEIEMRKGLIYCESKFESWQENVTIVVTALVLVCGFDMCA